MLQHTFPRHRYGIPGALATFPEAMALLASQGRVTDATVFWSVVLLS